jgi:hypothetical protein
VAGNDPEGSDGVLAGQIAARYDLGACTRVLRAVRDGPWPIVAIFVGIGVFGAADRMLSPYAALAALAIYAVGYLVARRTVWPRKVDRVFWFANGLAQLTDGTPTARVVRFDQVTSVTVARKTGETNGVESCTLRDGAQVQVTVGSAYGVIAGEEVLREADRVLSPRLAGPMIRAYDSGEPVTLGSATVDRSGISAARASGKVSLAAWPEIRQVGLLIGDFGVEVHAGKRRPLRVIITEEPNCVFLFDLIRHAAAEHGIPLDTRYPAAPPRPDLSWSARLRR